MRGGGAGLALTGGQRGRPMSIPLVAPVNRVGCRSPIQRLPPGCAFFGASELCPMRSLGRRFLKGQLPHAGRLSQPSGGA